MPTIKIERTTKNAESLFYNLIGNTIYHVHSKYHFKIEKQLKLKYKLQVDSQLQIKTGRCAYLRNKYN